MATKSYHIEGFGPSDLLTSDNIGIRRSKVSSADSRLSAAINEKLFSIIASYDVASGQKLALNLNFASDVIIHSIFVDSGFPYSIHNQHSTGDADGIFESHELNICSTDVSPSNGQVYYNAIVAGDEIDFSYGLISPYIVACEDSKLSVVATNTSGDTANVKMVVKFEEFGARNPIFGITPTTQLEPETEMSLYG